MSSWTLWDDLCVIIKKVSPVLGSVIETTSPLSSMVIALISQVFGANKTDAQDIINKIKSDPEAAIKLKKIEYDHQESLQNIASENFKTEVDDRKSARDMNVHLHNFVPTIIAIGYCLTYVIIQFYCIMHPQIANDVISARLHDGLMMILAYFFGRNHDNIFNNNKDT